MGQRIRLINLRLDSLKKIGVAEDALEGVLTGAKYKTKEITKALDGVNKSANSSIPIISKLKTGFTGLAASLKMPVCLDNRDGNHSVVLPGKRGSDVLFLLVDKMIR